MSLKFSDLREFSPMQIARLKKEYEPIRGKTISIPNANKLGTMMDRLSKDMLMKLANADIPFVTTSAISKLVMKHGMKFTDFTAKQLNMSEADELQTEACWTGYKQVGMKKKGDRMVPNCVPESVVKEMFGEMMYEINDLRGSFTDAQLERMKQDWKNKPASALTPSVKQMIMKMDAPTRAALENAKINHISKFAGSTFEQKESIDPTCKICEGEQCQCSQGEDMQEGMVKRVMQTIHDKLSKEGGAAGFDDLAKEVKKEFGITISKDTLKNMPGVKQHRDGDYILEADLSKSQIKMVHKAADKLSKKDFVKRYGKDGDSVRYATATNMVKKKLGIAETTKQKINKGETEMQEQSYKDKFNATMKDFGIKSLGDLKTDDEKKKFFKAVDAKHVAKNEELDEMKHEMAHEMMKKEMMKKVEMLKAEKDPKKMEMMRKEMMKEMEKMPEMMKKEMMKKMEMAMKEAEVPAEPMKKLNTGEKMKNEEAEPLTRPTMSLKDKMKINAMKMPIRSMKMNAMKDMNAMKMEMMKEMTEMMKKEMMKEMDDMPEMMKKEMMKEMKNMMEMKMKSEMKKMEMMKAERDPAKMEMMKSEMMKEMMKEMKMEMMKKMKEMMKEYGSMNAMKKPMNAMMKKESNKYLDTKAGSIQDIARQMFEKEHQLVEVKGDDIEKMISDYLKKGGTITKLPPALAKGMKQSDMQKHKVGKMGVMKAMKMKEVRDFVDTYNKHFLTNWAAEELLAQK